MASTLFSDVIVNATDLRKNQKQWLEMAYSRPVTISYGHRQLSIVNRDQVRGLYLAKHYIELLLKFCQEFQESSSSTFPWMDYLTEEEKMQFYKELLTAATIATVSEDADDWTKMDYVIEDWKATAELERSPKIVEHLRRKVAPDEYVKLER